MNFTITQLCLGITTKSYEQNKPWTKHRYSKFTFNVLKRRAWKQKPIIVSIFKKGKILNKKTPTQIKIFDEKIVS